ncbi:alpha/beta hydrolase [Butyrivibrio sp. YAB3001]|uniref:alpha/beta hydrolase n=1 Tax=Butyrivibrio sp. YAB3001 TaxID=1520812 RepID=UPI0008F68D76|nr:alpha/beta hydrolase [Butyrivibrio sp. YAB3001]SFC47693.1 Acetyl esterase/lipase [Butyrivibrio sp. YAB3001]
MKYNIDKELRSFSLCSGTVIGRLYPIINIGYRLNKCKSDKYVNVKKYDAPGYNGEKISTLVIEPKQYSGKLPCIFFFHGGGFILRASKAHYQIAKWYAQRAHCKVIFPDYRLLPKHKYPVAVEDCYSVYVWALEIAEKLGINKDMTIVTGDSAGGNISGAITTMLNDRGFPLPKGMMLIYPVLDRRMITESMKRFTDTPIWDSRCMKWFWNLYLGEQASEHGNYYSISELKSLNFFPKTYVEVAEYDCLRDEGHKFAKRLVSEGISAEVHQISGACHGYESALKSSIVEKCMNRRIDWIKEIFVDHAY